MDLEIRDIRKYPWFWIQNEILTVYGSKIGPAGLAVYCALSHASRNNSQQIKTSLRQLGLSLGMSQQTAMRSLDVLINLSLLRVVKKSKSVSDGPSIYELLAVPIGNGTPTPFHQESECVPPEKRSRSVMKANAFHQESTYNTNTIKLEGLNTTEEPFLFSKPSLFSKENILELENPSDSIKSSRNKHKEKPCDPRHAPVRAAIIEKYSAANGGDKPAWNGREAKRLSLFLDYHKDWSVEKIIGCVENRFLSEENHAEDPIAWISKLAKYAAGPVDIFGKPLGAQNGTKQEQRRIKNQRAILAGMASELGEEFKLTGATVHDRLKS